jgi:hypothetical protein
MMKNPFEYTGANNIPQGDVMDYFIDDNNFSRLIQSTKNVFLIGERGSGKTITLLYSSFKIQYGIALRDKTPIPYDKIGIHITCKESLFDKGEYLLLNDEYKRLIFNEHFLVGTLLHAIADTLGEIPEIVCASKEIEDKLFSDIEYLWDVKLNHSTKHFFEAISQYADREIKKSQQIINSISSDGFYENAMSFATTIIPFLEISRQIQILSSTHYMLMIDDAQDLNKYHMMILNSWIAYRDHSLFSFKIATIQLPNPIRYTSSQGSIIEGHDYITINLEQPYQNQKTDFYKLSEKIIKRRLEKIGLSVSVTDFFPASPSFTRDIESFKEKAREEAIVKYGKENTKSVNDYVYKYHRAMYFRNRGNTANKPPYSGFETIIDISTGIVRNMLEPCFWMYDSAINENKGVIQAINPTIQNNVIIERSEFLWKQLMQGLDCIVPDCSKQQGTYISNLFEQLMILFAKRLKSAISEPCAIVFSISQIDIYPDKYKEIQELLEIARRAQYVYMRVGNAKEKGKKEIYYVPNRMLFPNFGLDPHGQFARVSLKVSDIYNAAYNKTAFPFDPKDDTAVTIDNQLKLF